MTPEEEDINRQPAVLMEISSLDLSGPPGPADADPMHLEATVVVQGKLPPIVVHRSTMQVICGHHRVQAALRRGESTITGRFFDGSGDEAFVLSVLLNVSHGRPLDLADRKRAAESVTNSHPQWSDRRVAAVTGISPGTVADIRRRVAGASAPDSSRIGQDGRVRPLDCSAGRRLAGQLMTENPNMSLRQVAKAAAISPETARDVRNRLLSGEDPALVRRTRGTAPAPANGKDRVRRPLNLVRSGGGPEPVIDRAVVVNRLIGDPALRYTDTGRNLLRLLTLHTHWTEQWDAIVDNVPPHCTDVVTDLARQFADQWADFAARVGTGRIAIDDAGFQPDAKGRAMAYDLVSDAG